MTFGLNDSSLVFTFQIQRAKSYYIVDFFVWMSG